MVGREEMVSMGEAVKVLFWMRGARRSDTPGILLYCYKCDLVVDFLRVRSQGVTAECVTYKLD